MNGVESRLDGNTLVVRLPMRFQRRGGRKRIVAPDGSELAPRSKPEPDGTLVKALARAWRWQRMLDDGVFASVSEIGDAENISKSYVSRILRLALLAPDIIEMILGGRSERNPPAEAAFVCGVRRARIAHATSLTTGCETSPWVRECRGSRSFEGRRAGAGRKRRSVGWSQRRWFPARPCTRSPSAMA